MLNTVQFQMIAIVRDSLINQVEPLSCILGTSSGDRGVLK